MKKILLFSSLICSLFFSLAAFAYQTLIIDFPPKSKWNVVYYRNLETEAILQYVPSGQTYNNWQQTVIVHSYKEATYAAGQFLDILTLQLQHQNPTGKYKYLKYTGYDSVAIRVTNNYNGIKGHCEIFRTTKAPEGLMTIQYIDRNKEHFRENGNTWLKIVKDARTYNSYWRDERVMNKGESYEL